MGNDYFHYKGFRRAVSRIISKDVSLAIHIGYPKHDRHPLSRKLARAKNVQQLKLF